MWSFNPEMYSNAMIILIGSNNKDTRYISHISTRVQPDQFGGLVIEFTIKF